MTERISPRCTGSTKRQVISEVTSAGFQLAAEGNFLNRPADDHHLPIFDPRSAVTRTNMR